MLETIWAEIIYAGDMLLTSYRSFACVNGMTKWEIPGQTLKWSLHGASWVRLKARVHGRHSSALSWVLFVCPVSGPVSWSPLWAGLLFPIHSGNTTVPGQQEILLKPESCLYSCPGSRWHLRWVSKFQRESIWMTGPYLRVVLAQPTTVRCHMVAMATCVMMSS